MVTVMTRGKYKAQQSKLQLLSRNKYYLFGLLFTLGSHYLFKCISFDTPSILTNSSCGLIFVKVGAKYGHIFSKNKGENTGNIQEKFKITKHGQNHENTGKITKIRAKLRKYGQNQENIGKITKLCTAPCTMYQNSEYPIFQTFS